MIIKSLGVLLFSCCLGFQIGFSQSDYLKISQEISHYLEDVSLKSNDLISWPVMPEKSENVAVNLYSGVPGIILFYLELYNATSDIKYINIAKKGAQYLISELPDTFPGHYQLGLYTGASGIAFTLNKVYEATGEKIFLKSAKDWMQFVFEDVSSNSEDDFGNVTDIIYGAAGIGLTAIDFLANGHQQKLFNLVKHCADFLVESTHVTANEVRWKMNPGMNYFMDNFSHGTAGNAFFLLKAFQVTKDTVYRQLGLKAASYLHNVAGNSGMVCHHQPGGEDLFYLSWCHGPPGTSRLFMEAYRLTGDNKYLDGVLEAAYSMLEFNLHENNTPGFSYLQ